MLEYKIVEKAQFTVMGIARKFSMENSYTEVTKYWDEYMSSGESRILCGMFGVCIDCEENEFVYLIADNYLPWNDVPEGYETRVIPAGTWAVFPCNGPIPKTLQEVNTKIWNEWLPSCKSYRLAGNYNIEMYAPKPDQPDEIYAEIWIPVEKI